MVATQQEEVFWVFNLVGQHQADGLDRLFSPVHVISQEQVVSFSREAGVLKEFNEVGVLTVDVTWVRRELPHILMGASSSRSIGC